MLGEDGGRWKPGSSCEAWRFLRITSTAAHQVRIIGPVEYLITHFDGRKTVVCLGPDRCGLHDLLERRKAFVPVELAVRDLNHNWSREMCILELPERAAEDLYNLSVTAAVENPSGFCLEIRRHDRRPNSRLLLKLVKPWDVAMPVEARIADFLRVKLRPDSWLRKERPHANNV